MARNIRAYLCQINWYIAASGLVLTLAPKAQAQSNIVPDNTLGDESSIVNPNVEGLAIELITGGAQRGQNLFHSFSEFNVSEGRSAYFLSPNADITNILSRVTGNNISEIFGTLGTIGESQPNLFLINPNGIIFGENASLDLGGSFVATTASSIQFSEQGFFNAIDPEAPPLLTVQPSAFFFNQTNPGTIENNSVAEIETDADSSEIVGLQTPDGESLLFVGGDIVLDGGNIFAPEGNVELLAIAGEGRVGFNFNNGLRLNVTEDLLKADISLLDRAEINVGGIEPGNINLNSRNIDISDFSSLFAQADFNSPNSQPGDINLEATKNIQVGRNIINGGNISFRSESLSLAGSSLISDSTQENQNNITLTASDSVSITGGSIKNQTADAAGGNIDIEAGSFSLIDGAKLSTVTIGQGNPGDINIQARELVTIGGVDLFGAAGGISTSISSVTDLSDSRQSGDININARTIALTDGTFLNAAAFDGVSSGGKINLNADNITIANGARINVIGANSGSVGIETQNLEILQNSFILGGIGRASGFANARAGDITINASDTILIESSQVFSQVGEVGIDSNSVGDAGNIIINTNSLELTNPSLEADNRAQISSRTFGDGDAGNLIINVGQLTVAQGSFISGSTGSQGKGGNLEVNASESVELIGSTLNNPPTSLLVQTGSRGQGGNINLIAPKLIVRDGAGISTQAFGEGQGGNVNLQVADSIELIGVFESDSSFFVSGIFSLTSGRFTDNPAGDAGNLTVQTGTLAILNGARIDASTISEGQAGEINITALESIKLAGTSPSGIPSLLSTDTASDFVEPENAGDAGNLNIITNSLNISDRTRISATTSTNGNGGNINIFLDNIDIENNSQVAVNSTGNGVGGDINLVANNLALDNNSLITAETFSANGGNINLDIADLITLNNQSNISATAGTAEAGGDGGNITIDTQFIVAFSNGSNDITANAFEGAGGNIDISAEALFGIQPRDSNPPNDTNDIDASSQFGLDGDVAIDTPDVDPIRGLDNLPTNLVDASRLIARNCLSTGDDRLNEFIITGRGGLPNNPNEFLSGEVTLSADWVSLPETNKKAIAKTTASVSQSPIVEAKGWKTKPDGTVVLVAENSTPQFTIPWMGSHSCNAI